jgi:hypothetical protein
VNYGDAELRGRYTQLRFGITGTLYATPLRVHGEPRRAPSGSTVSPILEGRGDVRLPAARRVTLPYLAAPRQGTGRGYPPRRFGHILPSDVTGVDA